MTARKPAKKARHRAPTNAEIVNGEGAHLINEPPMTKPKQEAPKGREHFYAACGIVEALIVGYEEVGQPYEDYLDRGWSEAKAERTLRELKKIAARYRRLARGRT